MTEGVGRRDSRAALLGLAFVLLGAFVLAVMGSRGAQATGRFDTPRPVQFGSRDSGCNVEAISGQLVGIFGYNGSIAVVPQKLCQLF